jgi:hypothetical protein
MGGGGIEILSAGRTRGLERAGNISDPDCGNDDLSM